MLPKITGFHIEPTNICTLKCAGCARTRFIDQWPQQWKNHNLDIDSLMRFLDIDLKDTTINLCGNYGDPIYYPSLHDMVRAFKNRWANLVITTNGSYRDPAWWDELCKLLDEKDVIRFSIDGIPSNFTEYRQNAEWNSIERAIKICSEAKVKTVWKYIVFAFNQDNIEQARELSQSLGVDNFKIEYSDRFDNKTQNLIPTVNFVGGRKNSQDEFKQGNREIGVNPKCHNRREHFISAQGYYSPCCYIADHRFYYKTDWGKNRNKIYDISKTSIGRLISESSVIEFYQNITKTPIDACKFNCPAVD